MSDIHTLRVSLRGALVLAGCFVLLAGVPASAESNNPGVTTSRTQKPGSATSGCISCHTQNTAISASISGPASLHAGDFGIFRITVSKTGEATQRNFGFDVAASDAAAVLSTVTGEPAQTYDVGGNPANREVTHNAPGGVTLRKINTATNYYLFKYTMPAAAAVNSQHTLYGTSVVGPSTGGGWNHAANFPVTTKALPAAPASVNSIGATGGSITLQWSGGGPQYLVLHRIGTYPTGPTDPNAVIGYGGSNTSATVTGLAPSSSYYFSVFSRDVGESSGASFHSSTAAQTIASTVAGIIWVVNVNAGSDSGSGTPNSPFKTITKAMSLALENDTIRVAAGTYNVSSGETFPIVMRSGVQLKSDSGALVTIVDATGAGRRVFYCENNNDVTLIEGFTITGGFNKPTFANNARTAGGGIYTYGLDYTTISRNIITGNTVAGFDGEEGPAGTVWGGGAVGGGIASGSSNRIVNNIIRNNIARGGNGISRPNEQPFGGYADAGGVLMEGAGGVLVNNTIYGNAAIGGNAGNNTGSGNGAYGGAASGGGVTAWDGNSVINCIVANNATTPGLGGAAGTGGIAGANGTTEAAGMFGTAAVTNSLFHNNTAGGAASHGTTGTAPVLDQDPLFVSAPHDLHLRASSAAIGAGTSSGAPTTDLDLVIRSSPPAIGAFEYTCPIIITPAEENFPAAGGSDSIAVAPEGECAWTATAPAGSFVTITSGGSGTGNGNVTYTVASNSSTTARTTTLTVAGKSFVVTQNANGVTSMSLVAAASATQVALSWTAVAGATSYEVQRNSGAGYSTVATTSALSHNDTSVLTGTGYLYRILAAAGGALAYSNADLAVVFSFTDPTLGTGTMIKAAHFTELRAAANAARAALGWSPLSFTGTVAAGQIILRSHLMELRSAIDNARAGAGLGPLSHESVVSGSTPVRGAHVSSLRSGLQ